jgi:hypothetical protein
VDITLDFPINPRPRWGYGQPPHQRLCRILDAGRERYRQHVREIVALGSLLRSIPLVERKGDPLSPVWLNPFFSGLDLAALYMFVARYRPKRFVEIGSGWTTKIARRAATDASWNMHITSIDPEPRAEVDRLCDFVVRQPLEEVDQSLTRDLAEGNILFLDGSHRVFTNSDCVVFFLEILPELKPGVLVHVHDIFLPYDYPPDWNRRFYSEQYLLAAWLLAEPSRAKIELPNLFVSEDPQRRSELAPLWDGHLDGVALHGGSFWLRMSD